MKRIMQLLTVMCMLLLGTQLTFAWENGSHKEDIYDGDAMLEVKTFVIGNIYYMPQDGEPTQEDLLNILYNQAVKNTKKSEYTFTSYPDFCQEINKRDHVDIYRLGRRKALEIFKEKVGSLADAYIVCTVSNDTRLNVFYDVVSAKTHEVIYSYRKLAPKSSVRDELLYNEMTADFYNGFQHRVKKLMEEKAEEEKAILKMGKEKYEEYKKKQAAEKKKKEQSYQSSYETFKENGPELGRGHKVE
ncbi:MAG: hypothetical protein K6C05_00665 [Anaerovibrio sp.]|uniref:hypothetical protein n=1 Tax=Anaerovibrio sp. TaxID=1872532 RepID=UPI0025F057B8|nr:hypothetical protein [Anaerovibrio sp.]MCR5175340.1 hypothetical protein [Anaerovibrio sp.]